MHADPRVASAFGTSGLSHQRVASSSLGFEDQSTLRNLVAELLFKNELLRSDLLETRDRLGRIKAFVADCDSWQSQAVTREELVEALLALLSPEDQRAGPVEWNELS